MIKNAASKPTPSNPPSKSSTPSTPPKPAVISRPPDTFRPAPARVSLPAIRFDTLNGGKTGGIWQNNKDAVRVAQDIHLEEAKALGPFDGRGTNIAVVDTAWGPKWTAELLQKITRNENLGADPGHFDLQKSLAGDLAAPGANVGGRALINGTGDWMGWSIGNGPSMGERVKDALGKAITDVGPNGVISFTAVPGPLSQQDALAMIQQMKDFTKGGGTVVMGAAVLSPENWKDPVVQQAVKDAKIIVVDSPLSGPQATYPKEVAKSGESIPAEASSAVTISVPSPNGWNSVTVAQVAGVVALMKQANPKLTGQDIQAILSDPTTFSQKVPTTDGSMVPLFDAKEAVQAAINSR